MSKFVVLPVIFGVLILAGCEEQRRTYDQPMYQPPPEHYQQPQQQPQQQQHPQQPQMDQSPQPGARSPETQREMYFSQGQQQIAQLENAIQHLEQTASQLQIQDVYEPYREELAQHLDTAVSHLRTVQQAESGQLNTAVDELVAAIDVLLNSYNEAATLVHQQADTPQDAPGF